MISAGSETRFPADRPNIAQARKRAAAFVVCVIANSAAAWLTSDSAVTRRRSRRNADTPTARRPTIAMMVRRATVNPAWVRPIAGSRKAIWCTKNPTWAISARANGPATLQNARLRNASARVQRGGAKAEPAPDLDPPCGRKTPVASVRTGGRSIPMVMAGMRIAAMMVGATKNAAGARDVERQADRKPALAIEPQANNVGDRVFFY